MVLRVRCIIPCPCSFWDWAGSHNEGELHMTDSRKQRERVQEKPKDLQSCAPRDLDSIALYMISKSRTIFSRFLPSLEKERKSLPSLFQISKDFKTTESYISRRNQYYWQIDIINCPHDNGIILKTSSQADFIVTCFGIL